MIDKFLIDQFSSRLTNEDVNNILLNSVSNNKANRIFLNRELINNYNHVFSKKRRTVQNISDQFNTGRCWIFAFNNVIRKGT